MFIQTRGPLVACMLNDYVLKKCLLGIWGPPGARGHGARAPMAPLLIRHCIDPLRWSVDGAASTGDVVCRLFSTTLTDLGLSLVVWYSVQNRKAAASTATRQTLYIGLHSFDSLIVNNMVNTGRSLIEIICATM